MRRPRSFLMKNTIPSEVLRTRLATLAHEASLKRYRFTGTERDNETGFYYHRARYYAPWVGRWTSPDPRGLVDGTNLFVYARDNPVVNTDSTGTQCDPSTQSCVNPTEPTAREEALQQSLPEGERNQPPPSPPVAANDQTHSGVPWETGPRGEHIPLDGYTGRLRLLTLIRNHMHVCTQNRETMKPPSSPRITCARRAMS